jgi:hypothetical protein
LHIRAHPPRKTASHLVLIGSAVELGLERIGRRGHLAERKRGGEYFDQKRIQGESDFR